MQEVVSLFWIFLISSFLGFLLETVWCIIKYKKIEWRKSLIYEPMIPIYGIAGLLILEICNYFSIYENEKIFLIGFFVSTSIEFISSVLQEKIFGTVSWDYSKIPLNVGGRVNVFYSILFGLTSVLFYKGFLFPLYQFFLSIPLTIFLILFFFLTVFFFLYDVILSFLVSFRMKERRNQKKREGKFWNYIDTKYNDAFLKKIYSNAVVVAKNNKNSKK